MSVTDKKLIYIKEKQIVTIKNILAGQHATKRLADLGLIPQTKIKLLKKAPLWGPLEIEVRSSKLVLGYGLASKIIVN